MGPPRGLDRAELREEAEAPVGPRCVRAAAGEEPLGFRAVHAARRRLRSGRMARASRTLFLIASLSSSSSLALADDAQMPYADPRETLIPGNPGMPGGI